MGGEGRRRNQKLVWIPQPPQAEGRGGGDEAERGAVWQPRVGGEGEGAQKEGAYGTYPEERWRWEVKVEAEGVAKGRKGGKGRTLVAELL